MKPRRVGLKYCGGCQPRYDRTAAVDRLARRLAGRIVLVPWNDPQAESVLVVCGCEVACADVAAIDKPRVWAVSKAQVDAVTLEEMP